MKKIILVTILLFNQTVNAQDANNNSSRFSNRSEIELGSNGDNDLGIGIETINGCQINNRWFIGVGVGFVHQSNQTTTFNSAITYSLSTLPVFIDFKFDIPRSGHSFYFYLDGGYSVLLSTAKFNAVDSTIYDIPTYNTSLESGLTAAGGFGYSKLIGTQTQWTIGLGLTLTGIIENSTYVDLWTAVSGTPVSNSNSQLQGGFIYVHSGFIF